MDRGGQIASATARTVAAPKRIQSALMTGWSGRRRRRWMAQTAFPMSTAMPVAQADKELGQVQPSE